MLDVIRGAFVPRVGRVLLAPCLVSAALAMACGGAGDLPTDSPTVTPTTENFTETLQKNGAATIVFSEGSPGTVTATITTLSPQTDISLSFSMGTRDGATCSVAVSNDAAIVNTSLTGDAAAGSFCARVSDTSEKVTGMENVGVTIVHY